ncbi:MAG: TRAP transporter large permease subunit [Magnetovibrio sp.]|nr:TRAP transporter large permease subunit [Magnetovibrio sp.]
MPLNDILSITMFLTVCFFLLGGFPVAFSLAGTGLFFATLGWFFGAFDFGLLGNIVSRIFGSMTNNILIAVPMFIFMGVMLERSKVAEELLESLGHLFGSLRGGLGISVTIVGALLAASTGIVGATVVTMGLLSMPTMLKNGYSPRLISGTICASGTLGQIIPPSIVLVILGDQISNAYVNAQRMMGNFSPEPVSVGDLFAGALLPGLMLVFMYIAYQVLIAIFKPEYSPALVQNEGAEKQDLARIFRALIPPIALIICVLGSILAGVATPTEAASVGAVGAILLAGARLDISRALPIYLGIASMVMLLILTNNFDLRVARTEIATGDQIAIYGAMVACLILAYSIFSALMRIFNARTEESDNRILFDVTISTLKITTMVFVILIGASVFSLVFRGLGGDDLVHAALNDLPGGKWGAIFVVMLVMFFLGFILDFIEITFVVVPIVAPVLLMMDVNPVWLGIMMAMNLQTSFLTPPFGFALFYLRGVAPDSVSTSDIYKGVLPFVVIQMIGLLILALFPALATWLPSVIFGD